MLTLEHAKALKYGDVLTDTAGKKWRVNGKVKTWKRDTSRVQVPVKHGLYRYDYITELSLNEVTLIAR